MHTSETAMNNILRPHQQQEGIKRNARDEDESKGREEYPSIKKSGTWFEKRVKGREHQHLRSPQ